MIIQQLTFSNDLNTSLQPGDIVYYSPTVTVGSSGFNTVYTVGTIITFGIVVDIYPDGLGGIPPNTITVIYDNTNAATPPPSAGDFIMFGKNKEVNSSSLKGYYAEAKFVNYSTEKIELFSIGSEVSESSK